MCSAPAGRSAGETDVRIDVALRARITLGSRLHGRGLAEDYKDRESMHLSLVSVGGI